MLLRNLKKSLTKFFNLATFIGLHCLPCAGDGIAFASFTRAVNHRFTSTFYVFYMHRYIVLPIYNIIIKLIFIFL